MGKLIAGCFYSEEIFKINFPNEYLIEKIIRKKGKQVFFKLFEFDNTHNSWINTRDVQKINVSSTLAMNVIGIPQAGDTKNIITNIKHIHINLIKSNSSSNKITNLFMCKNNK